MATKIFKLKEQILKEIPKGELPHVVFSRMMLKTGMLWSLIKEDTDVPQEEFKKALGAAEELFGKKFHI